MTILAALLGIVLMSMCSNLIVVNRRLRAQIHSNTIAARTDDEDIVAYLEASADASPLARKLLNASKSEGALTQTPEWKHSTSTDTPPEVHWKLFLDDLKLEQSDDARLECVKAWIDGGNKFTITEQVEMASLFTTEEGRFALRKTLNDQGKRKSVYACLWILVSDNMTRWYLEAGKFTNEAEAVGHITSLANKEIAEKKYEGKLRTQVKKLS